MMTAIGIIGIWIKNQSNQIKVGRYGCVLKYWIMGNKNKFGFVVRIMTFGRSMQRM
jgi:hypothetical protein